MARFMADFYVNRPDADQFIAFVSQDFFGKEGYQYVNFKGENVWKKGVGALAAPQFIKLEYMGGRVHLEAWLRTVWLPGVYGGEMDFTGAWGFAVKDSFHKTVNQLIGLLQQSQVLQNGAAPQQPTEPAGQTAPDMQQAPPAVQGAQNFRQEAPQQVYQPQQQAPQGVPVFVHDPKGSATLALVMGLVSILGIWIPIIGIVCGIIGIVSGRKGMRSTAKGMGTAGFVLSVVFLAVSIIVAVFSAMMLLAFGYYAY